MNAVVRIEAAFPECQCRFASVREAAEAMVQGFGYKLSHARNAISKICAGAEYPNRTYKFDRFLWCYDIPDLVEHTILSHKIRSLDLSSTDVLTLRRMWMGYISGQLESKHGIPLARAAQEAGEKSKP